MPDDPLMPAHHRFPRDVWPPVGADERPSELRPFALRGARWVEQSPAVRHRTDPHQTPHPQTTNRDNREDDDTWYTPDD